MQSPAFILRFIIVLCMILQGCANIVAPTGGERDTIPPKLITVNPPDSSLNARITRIELRFDEYVAVNDAAAQIQLSPITEAPPTVIANKKRIIVEIPDSLLKERTTYRLNFGKGIADTHEGNAFTGYSYLFSTGEYFDSLKLGGIVLNAATGMPDTGALVILHEANSPDSIILRTKPSYAIHVDASGRWTLEGLPARGFRMYALRDINNNYHYDGGDEWIAFIDRTVMPDTLEAADTLRTFPEIILPDTTVAATNSGRINSKFRQRGSAVAPAITGGYKVEADTANLQQRTQDLRKPLTITFQQWPPDMNAEKILLTFDSSGIEVEAPVSFSNDSIRQSVLINTSWKEDALYTLRLQKGFAKDTAGNDFTPGRYSFRTKRADDYATLEIRIPAPYRGDRYIFEAVQESDTIYHRPVTDSIVRLPRLTPGSFMLRIIVDENGNGHWDTGDIFAKKQPEVVIPHFETQTLKAGWDNIIDFINVAPAGKKGRLGTSASEPGGGLQGVAPK